MITLSPTLSIGGNEVCHVPDAGEAMVHACKYQCFHKKAGIVTKKSPNYLGVEESRQLWLNLMDSEEPAFRVSSFQRFLAFARRWHAAGKRLVIHDNKGKSRAPSLALLFLAKITEELPNTSYDDAYDGFERICPDYKPGAGIEQFLREHWKEIDAERLIGATPKNLPPPVSAKGEIDAEIAIQTLPLAHWMTCVEITDKNSRFVRPVPNILQIRMDQAYVTCINILGVGCRMLVMKPRQVGCSTFAGQLVYHHCRRFPSNALMMADVGKRTSKIWDIFNGYAERDAFPWPSRYKFNTESGTLKYPGGITGEVEKDTALDPKAGRAGTRNVVWYSEVAYYAKDGVSEDTKVIQGSLASVPNTETSLVIGETTANGASGWFYKNWQKAVTLEEFGSGTTGNGWIKVFAAWFEFSIEQLAGNKVKRSARELELIRETLTEREKRLIELYGNEGPQGKRLGTVNEVDTLWEHLAWRREVLEAQCGGNEMTFDQDFPEDPESCFLASGRPRFNIKGVTRLELMAKHDTLAKTGVLEEKDGRLLWLPTDGDESWLWVLEKPTDGRSYLAFLDPCTGEQASGSDDPDSHAFGVWRTGMMQGFTALPTELVCVIDVPGGCRWDADLLTERIALVLQWYGNCMIVPEVNIEPAIANDLRGRGCSVYHRRHFDKIMPDKSEDVIGWKTTAGAGGTRSIVVNAMAQAIREETIAIRYQPFVDQLRTFVVNQQGKAEARGGAHDDWVMGGGIGLACLDYATKLIKPEFHFREKRSNEGTS